MSNPAEKIARLLGTGKKSRRLHPTKGGNLLCLCPAHNDRTPSLGIMWNGKRPVFQCYAGCDFRDIAKALRAHGIDPMTGDPPEHKTQTKFTPRTVEKKEPDTQTVFETYWKDYNYSPREAPHWLENRHANRPAPPGYRKTAYVYRDTDGWPMALVYRFDKVDPLVADDQKKMLILTPWVHKTDKSIRIPPLPPPHPIPPYGAESLHRPGPILIVEGEKCRSRLNDLIQGKLPVITPLNAHMHSTNMSAIINSGRRTITLPDYSNGQSFVDELNEVIGDRNTICPSPWRLGDMPVPKGWDIADEIDAKSPWDGVEITPLTIEELAQHLRRCAKKTDPGPDQDTLLIAAKALESD